MKQLLLSSLTATMALLAMTPLASATSQTNLQNSSADLNGDGVVTLLELKEHNRDYRGG